MIFVDLMPLEELKPSKQITLLKNELNSYKDDLTQKISWVICNKIDLIDSSECKNIKKEIESELKIPSDDIYFISAFTGEGTEILLKKLETEIFRIES